MNDAEFKNELKNQLQHAPILKPAVGDLVGYWKIVDDGESFVCANCASRVMARGFSIPDAHPCWPDEPYGVCVGCGQ